MYPREKRHSTTAHRVCALGDPTLRVRLPAGAIAQSINYGTASDHDLRVLQAGRFQRGRERAEPRIWDRWTRGPNFLFVRDPGAIPEAPLIGSAAGHLYA